MKEYIIFLPFIFRDKNSIIRDKRTTLEFIYGMMQVGVLRPKKIFFNK